MSWLVDFVKEKEGFRKNAYQDSVGVWTIGYGATYYKDGTRVKKGDVVTEAEAEELLQDHLQEFLDYVIEFKEDNGYDWNSNQIGALTSFIFNLGKGRLRQVTGKGTRDNDTIARKMRLYDKAGGRTLRGLTVRRNEEADHFIA